MSKAIYELVNELPQNNITTLALKSLDKFIPGQWENITNFEEMIRQVTGENDEEMIQKIGDRLSGYLTIRLKGIKTPFGYIKP